MTKNQEYTIESLAKLQEFVQALEETLSEPVTIKKNPEEDSIHLSTENQALHLQVFPVMNEDITEVYHVEVLRQPDEFAETLTDLLGTPKRTPRTTNHRFSFLTKFYKNIIRRK